MRSSPGLCEDIDFLLFEAAMTSLRTPPYLEVATNIRVSCFERDLWLDLKVSSSGKAIKQ